MLATVIVLCVLVCVADYFIGIKEPWRKIIYFCLVALVVIALLSFLVPGLIPLRFGP